MQGRTLLKNIFVLVGGTGIAQLLPVIATPFLTRMYTPEEFGLLVLFTAVVSVLGVVSCARYELAVTQPQYDSDAKAILFLCFSISCAFSLFLFFIVLASEYINILPESFYTLGAWLYLVPLLVALSGFNMAFSYWFVRGQSYSVVSSSKIAQGSITASTQISLGYIQFTGGLILGYALGLVSSFVYYFWGGKGFKIIHLKRKYFPEIKKNLIEYKSLPKYSLLGAALDNISLQLPLFMIAKYFNLTFTGIFGLAYRMLNLPLYLIASSLYQILFQKVSKLAHEDPNEVYSIIKKSLFTLSLFCIPFLILSFWFSRSIFSHAFGDEWVESGVIAELLCFAMAVKFCATILSCVMALKENVKVGSLWQILNFFTLIFVLSYFSYLEFYDYVVAIVIHDVVLYSLYILIIMRCAKKMGQQ